MTGALNPFVWDRPLDDPSTIVGVDAFARRVALALRTETNVALFGPHGTGKTTFVNRLALELARSDGEDTPPVDVVVVDLRHVASLPGLAGCLHDALVAHPNRRLRRAVQAEPPAAGMAAEAADETVHAQLAALRSLSDRLVIVFDEFARLCHCPGDPLAILGSTLTSAGANRVALLFTGSIGNALQMILESADQPIFGEAVDLQLPAIDRVAFLAYLDDRFQATGKPADEDALNYLLNATGVHPRSTQQLAWECWVDTAPGEHVTLGTVIYAHDRLVQTMERSEFTGQLDLLMNGDEGEVNEARALQLLADRGSGNLTSRPVAARYGFSSHSRVMPALDRLQRRGLVDRRDRRDGRDGRDGGWYIVDPLFAEWLRRASPLADRAAAPEDE